MDQSKLGGRALAVFRAAERGEARLIVSAIVLAELYFLNAKHGYFPDFAQLYTQLVAKPYVRLVELDPQDVLDFSRDASVPEMHDRIIAGLARRLGYPLITRDGTVRAAGLVPVVW